MRVINECRVDFSYRLSSKSPLVIKTTFSNIVSTDIIKNILKIDKFVDKKLTYAFDILTYKVDISNVSNFIVTNVFFSDKIPLGTRFIENSVKINNIQIRCVSPQDGFSLYDIAPGCNINISFKVIVLPQCFCKIIKNCSIIEHDYTYNIENPPAKVFIPSNNVYIDVKRKVLKQLEVNNIINVSKSICKIEEYSTKVKILKVKVVNTPINEVYRNYKSNICTIVLIGTIEFKISCKLSSTNKSNYNKNKSDTIKIIADLFGFSCNILVPVGIAYGSKEKIKVQIDYASANLINKNTIFINTNLLLNY